ncbi:ribose-phosphate diphosphokinase [Tardiphaga sp.]|uniref:ribose-phosphate diphosphokinase n=1 Tax=Tardiphaga sp. TaxID=1926292 RepID=UPI00352BAA04
MIATIHHFAESLQAAHRLADLLGIDCRAVNVRRFPDGESLVRVEDTQRTAILYRSLDHPNEKLVELMLAASALRDRGASRIVLVAPYLGYMRQDIAFQPGEAVSQKVIGTLLAAHFDMLVTVDPHLHRTASLAAVAPGIDAVAVSAAETLVELLRPEITSAVMLIGPDAESRPWVETVAAPLGLQVLVGEKRRLGDRHVQLEIAGIERVQGRTVVLIDDLISSGGTLVRCAELLHAAGATRIEAVATHCLASPHDLAKLAAAGVARVRSTDTVAGPTASVAIAPALAAALVRWAPTAAQ